MPNEVKLGIGAFLGLFMLAVLWSGIYTVDEGERVVLLRNGAFVETKDPGMHLKLPFIDSAVPISVRTNTLRYENVAGYSKDQQSADMVVSINFHVLPGQVGELYSTYGSIDGVIAREITPKLHKGTKEVFGQFTAAEVVQNRKVFGDRVFENITSLLGSEKVIIESVQVENIDFSNAYEQSVEQRMLAEVEVQKVKQNWEKEKVSADIKRTQAQAEADARLAQAEAIAKSTELQGNAEAAAINAKGKALRDNPDLVELTKAERWNGELPTQMVPGSTVPFINIK